MTGCHTEKSRDTPCHSTYAGVSYWCILCIQYPPYILSASIHLYPCIHATPGDGDTLHRRACRAGTRSPWLLVGLIVLDFANHEKNQSFISCVLALQPLQSRDNELECLVHFCTAHPRSRSDWNPGWCRRGRSRCAQTLPSPSPHIAQSRRSSTQTLDLTPRIPTPSCASRPLSSHPLEDVRFARLAETTERGRVWRRLDLVCHSLNRIACTDRESDSPCVSIVTAIDRRSSRAMIILLPLSSNWRSSADPEAELHQLEAALIKPEAYLITPFMKSSSSRSISITSGARIHHILVLRLTVAQLSLLLWNVKLLVVLLFAPWTRT